MPDSGLRITHQWEKAGRVRAPELAATWARLEVYLDDECLTEVEETDTRDLRRWLDVPLYPLAEWIAYNWWSLVGASRSRWPTPQGVVEGKSLRQVGEGFPWPDLTIQPEGAWTSLRMQRDEGTTPGGRVRFLVAGEYVRRTAEVERSLGQFVDAVVRRLEDNGVTRTPLAEEWQAVQGSDDEERRFCVSAARLGLDPYDVPTSVAESMVEAWHEMQDEQTLADLLDSTEADELPAAIAWLRDARGRLDELAVPGIGARFDEIRLPPTQVLSRRPWVSGYEDARALRRHLGIPAAEPFPMSHFVEARTGARAVGLIEALSGGRRRPVALVPEDRGPASVRFLSARALHRLLRSPEADFSVLSGARSLGQRVQRAFAAELLAPADGILGLLDRASTDEAKLRAADHYGVSPIVIERQVENQLLAA